MCGGEKMALRKFRSHEPTLSIDNIGRCERSFSFPAEHWSAL